jgi:putative phosphoesterase
LKIGVISDTHGDVKAFTDALDVLNDTDILIHCGDIFYHGLFNMIKDSYNPLELAKIFNSIKKPIIYSKGNCDSEVDQLALDFNILDPVRDRKSVV